jgi:YHS domain-containing protein
MKNVVLLIAVLVSAGSIYAQSSVVFETGEGAIRGYDPVAYFKEGKPVVGLKEHVFKWNGASWYFSSKENLKLFQEKPELYAPQYGGYCAYGTAEGHKAPTQPDAWTIVNDKLYLNYNKNVQKDWKSDQAEFIRKADLNWPTVKDSNQRIKK